MKAGTLEKLVDSLTSDDGELESTYINIFFATYRTFAPTEKVLALLLDRYVFTKYVSKKHISHYTYLSLLYFVTDTKN